MNTLDTRLWQLETAYSVQCIHCFEREEVSEATPQEAITTLQSTGWVVHEIGPWCPKCVPLLSARNRRIHTFQVGDDIRTVSGTVGKILHLGTGYAQIRMPDGYPSVFCLCELVPARSREARTRKERP